MGNIIGSFLSGFTKVVNNLFEGPLNFISGKSCNSICGSKWDLFCYIENFCVVNLLKMATVLILLYIVLLFFYLLYKTGICGCLCRSLCRMLWTCMVSWFSIWEYVCAFLCCKTRNMVRQRHHKTHMREMEEYYYSTDTDDFADGSFSYHMPRRQWESPNFLYNRSTQCRRVRFKRSLRPRNHRVRVGISRNGVYMSRAGARPFKYGRDLGSTVHNIKVTQTSRFVRKGGNRVFGTHQKKRSW
ncbi:hypothetical protein Sjap_021593 [Stephania japonica]|uniref:Uncharacterized protein n=1 Tax=Stephania japonica TaxID=461633 RepID=A0AAP0EM91_9MAGN